MKDNKKLFWLVLIFTVFNLFFINKAYHIDDPFTITIAKAIGEHFIRVPQIYQGNLIFMGEVCDNPLFLGYYYAPIIKLLGDKEAWLHLFYLPFSLLVIISMYILSRRFVGKGIFTVLCLSVTPVFIVMSQNIMLDIPFLAFFLGALAAFIYGTDKDEKRLLFLAAILAGLAILTKYSGLLVILIMFAYALMTSKKRYAFFLLIPIAMFLLWCLHNLIFYQKIYFWIGLLMKGPAFSFKAVGIRMFAVLSFLSGTSICTIFLIPYLLGKKINRWLFILCLPIGVCPFLIEGFFAGYNNMEKSILAFLFVSSLFIIALIFKAGILSFFKKSPDKDNLFLFFWFISLLVFTIAVQFIAARFVLSLYPPVFLLIAKELGLKKVTVPLSLRNKFIFLLILITMIISVVLAIGDYQLAGIYRDFAGSLRKKLPADKGIYFCPASFDTNLCYGYAYYLRRYFPQAINAQPEIGSNKAGESIYIMPAGGFLAPPFYESCANYSSELVYSKELIGSFYYRGNVFLHDRKFHTGFYSHDWGLLPFYISLKKVTLETFEVYQITALPAANIVNP